MIGFALLVLMGVGQDRTYEFGQLRLDLEKGTYTYQGSLPSHLEDCSN